jgi:hypothetical protein
MAVLTGNGPIWPACGQPIDTAGPAVSSYPQRDKSRRAMDSVWVPFVEDIRFTPTRLVHTECYADENGACLP